jgi:4-hydroxy-3-polyprenylbenzoate decarboxylase
MEGPFGEATGHISDLPARRPTIQVSCITHRNDPIFRGTLEGTLPGSTSENGTMGAIQRAATAWNILENAEIPGILDVVCHPITVGVNIVVQIKKMYQGQPKQIAAALWGHGAARYKYKNVMVVEEEIDPSSYEQLDWAYAFRVNAGEGGITVFPNIFGSVLDPSTPLKDRDLGQLGCALWNRVLIDATRNWTFERKAEWNNERFPPTVKPAPEDTANVIERWSEYGFSDN